MHPLEYQSGTQNTKHRYNWKLPIWQIGTVTDSGAFSVSVRYWTQSDTGHSPILDTVRYWTQSDTGHGPILDIVQCWTHSDSRDAVRCWTQSDAGCSPILDTVQCWMQSDTRETVRFFKVITFYECDVSAICSPLVLQL